MTAILADAAIGLAWLGVAILVLADARRGLAVGVLLTASGLALALAAGGRSVEAMVLLIGGLLGAVAGLRANQRRGWGLLQPGSTPRVVLCVVLGGAGLWLGLAVLDGPGGGPARAAALIAIVLGGARLMGERDPRAALAAASVVALGAGALAALTATAATGALIGAVAAIALNLVPASAELEAGGG